MDQGPIHCSNLSSPPHAVGRVLPDAADGFCASGEAHDRCPDAPHVGVYVTDGEMLVPLGIRTDPWDRLELRLHGKDREIRFRLRWEPATGADLVAAFGAMVGRLG